MKQLMSKWFMVIAGTLFAGTLFMSTGNAALVVYADVNGDKVYDPSLVTMPGSTFTVSLFATEDGLHGGLTSYGVGTTLTPNLKILGASPAQQIANIVSDAQWDFPEVKTVSPSIEVIDVAFSDTFSGTVHLFDMTLEAPNAPGSYSISFKNVEPDITFDGFVGFDGFVYDPSIVFEITQVNVVPIPAALPLFTSALFGLAWWTRRRQPT